MRINDKYISPFTVEIQKAKQRYWHMWLIDSGGYAMPIA